MLLTIIFGCMLGILTGLLPGLGLFTGLVLVYPFLQTLNVQQLLMFYISMAAASQYMGSVSAIVLRIPGEANSIFALKESQILNEQNKTAESLGASAVGSMAGGIGAVVITFTLLNFLEPFVPYFFRSDLKAILLIFSMISFIIFSESNIIISLCLAVFGFLLSLVGISPFGTERTFGIDGLINGISWFPLILGIMVVPKLWFITNTATATVTTSKFYWNTGTVIRSTFAGYIGGLIPGISYLMGSKLAWLIEHKISGDPLKRLLAAETANNASAYSMLIPLLILSIPIVSSEVIIMNLANDKQFLFNWNTTIASGWFASTILPVILVNLVIGLIAYFGVRWLIFWNKIPYLHIILTLLLLISMLTISTNILQDVLIFLLFLIVGYSLIKIDVTPLVIAFLLGDQLEQNMTRVLIIYNLI
jgi:putative tricarboxylic transport membrane protein